MKRGLWCMVVAVFGTVCLEGGGAEGAILINEMLADPSAVSGDANGDGVINTTQDEFVELVNTGAGSVSLEGWSLSDLISVRHTFVSGAAIPASDFSWCLAAARRQGFRTPRSLPQGRWPSTTLAIR